MTGFEVLLLAILLDGWLGEPKFIWRKFHHPIILMGNLIKAFEVKLNTGEKKLRNGVLTIISLVIISICIGIVFDRLIGGTLLEVFVVGILLAFRSLYDHIIGVTNGLRLSLGDGRIMVSRIVGRDVTEMDETNVVRSTIESAAENLSDGFIAPVFWYLILGLPGIIVYKMINTADSMIAYKSEKYNEFGWATAKTDDLANWFPARITSVLILLSTRNFNSWEIVRKNSKLHRSPNAGWPEGAMASCLKVALAGPRSYNGVVGSDSYINPEGRYDLVKSDINSCGKILWKTWSLMFLIVFILASLLRFF